MSKEGSSLAKGRLWRTDGARSALRLALQLEGLGAADASARDPVGEVLLPAYLCDTVIPPFRQRGLGVRFYDVRPDLSVDLADLSRRLGDQTGQGRIWAVLFIHYFGFLQPEPVRRFFADLRHRGFGAGSPLVLEDLTHAVWTDLPGGPVGDYAVASYRKFGLPFDGGFLWARDADNAASGADSARGRARRASGGPGAEPDLHTWASPAHCLSALAWATEAAGRPADRLWEEAERLYDRDRLARSMAPSSLRRLIGLDREELVARRRAAYREAMETARDCPHGEPLWPHLPEGVCPLVLPMRAQTSAERGPMRAWLARRGLKTVLLWPLAPAVNPKEFPGAAEAAARLAAVLLPLPPGDNRAV